MKSWLARLIILVLTVATVGLMAPTAASADPRPYPGSSGYPAYNSRFWAGPAVPYLAGYVPQGLAYWGAQDDMIVSYYDDNDNGDYALLAVVDRLTGRVKKHVYVLSGHVGGLGVGSGYLWVADSNDGHPVVRRYSLAALKNTTSGHYLSFGTGIFAVAAGSYLTVAGGDVWVGLFTTSFDTSARLYRYNITAKGNLSKNPIASIVTPGRVQGVAFSGSDRVIFSQSYGRTNASRITVKNRTTGVSRSIGAPTMTQCVVIADGWLYVLYESGATLYRNGEDGHGTAKNPIAKLHYGSVSGLRALV